MNRMIILALYLLSAYSTVGYAVLNDAEEHIVATFRIQPPYPDDRLELPVSVEVASITDVDPHHLKLMRVEGENLVPVIYQVCDEGTPRIYWMLSESERTNKPITYMLIHAEFGRPIPRTRVIDDGKTLTLVSGYRPFLTYQYAIMPSPEGVDHSYGRSGFIHPLYTPHGQVLTRIQPKDHYDHYGIWNPWPRVAYEGETVDFWNLDEKQGTVRFAGFEAVCEGKVFSEFRAKQEHVVFEKDGSEKVALNEIRSVRIYRTDKDYYYADFSIELRCASESPFDIQQSSYGGFSWRTTDAWNIQNSVTTSGEKSRDNADNSSARWCMVQGEIDHDYAGAIVMSSPENYNHPEPLRVLSSNEHGKGDLFINFATTKNKDWYLEPGKTYTLHYRMLVYNNRFTADEAEAAWQSYTQPVPVTLE